jgi:hypothetical protein
MTAILMDEPVAMGLDWWRHEVLGVEADYDNRGFLIGIANSWGTGWGEDGFGWLTEGRSIASDQVIPAIPVAARP